MHKSKSLGSLVADAQESRGGAAPIFKEPRFSGSHVVTGIPGYRGFRPGRNELEAGTYKTMARDCRDSRAGVQYGRLTSDEKAPYVDKCWFDKMRKEILPEPKESFRGNPKAFLSEMPAAGDYRESAIPRGQSLPPHHEDCGPQGRGASVCGITSYTGFLPGYKSENVYGSTWGRNRMRSTAASLEQTRKTRQLSTTDARHPARSVVRLTKEGTAVPEAETDLFPEMVPFSNSYNDVKRGFSSCMFSGTHIDPAGRLGPSGAGASSRQPARQDSFGRHRPPPPVKPHGYAGCIPGKFAENVVGERMCKTNEIAKFLTYKNQIRVVQR